MIVTIAASHVTIIAIGKAIGMANIGPKDGRALPTYERVRELFHYDPETGVMSKDGFAVGWGRNQNHYLKVDIDGFKYLLHRVIVLWMTGAWPKSYVDHRDLDIYNNRWLNLRPCSKSANQANRLKRVDNTSGLKGVSWDCQRSLWKAQICQNGRRYCVGRFETKQEASEAYFRKAVELFGEFARAA